MLAMRARTHTTKRMKSIADQIQELISARDMFDFGSTASDTLQAKIDDLMEQLPATQETPDHETDRFLAKLYS